VVSARDIDSADGSILGSPTLFINGTRHDGSQDLQTDVGNHHTVDDPRGSGGRLPTANHRRWAVPTAVASPRSTSTSTKRMLK
jgi:hypothetical protein